MKKSSLIILFMVIYFGVNAQNYDYYYKNTYDENFCYMTDNSYRMQPGSTTEYANDDHDVLKKEEAFMKKLAKEAEEYVKSGKYMGVYYSVDGYFYYYPEGWKVPDTCTQVYDYNVLRYVYIQRWNQIYERKPNRVVFLF